MLGLDTELFGSRFGDELFGNLGNDHLDGGAGGDFMAGGLGDDQYNVDSVLDQVSENASAGTDLIYTSLNSYSLANIANVERLGFDSFRGSGDFIGVGNDLDNALFGGNGNDTLIGGVGADVLNGGSGSDTASYETATSKVSASLRVGSGSVGDALGDTYISIENLTGSRFDDTLAGDANANILDGGEGDDTLTGGAGSDTFHFDGPALGHDVIADFTSGQDIIQINGLFADANAALAAATQAGSDVIISVDASNSIRLSNFNLANLHASDFEIVPDALASAQLQVDTSLTQLVQAMASYPAAGSGCNSTSCVQMPNDPSLQNVVAASLH